MRFLLALALLLPLSAPAAASVRQFSSLALSADGAMVAAVEGDEGAHAAIVLRAAASGAVIRRIDPCARCRYTGLTFARSGALAFLARERADQVALMVDDGSGGRTAPRVVATIPGIAQTPRFSPDSGRIALLVTLGAAKEAGATQAGVRQIGEIGEHNDEQQLAVFDARTTRPARGVRALSPPGRYIYEYDWTPDGRGFVVTSALGNGDANWWVASLDAVDAASGAVRNIARPGVQINAPRVSPDGRTVAFIGGLMSDFGSVGGDVWTVPLAGGAPVNVTRDEPASFTSLAWTSGGLRASMLRGETMAAVTLAAATAPRVLYAKPASFAAGDGAVVWSADGAVLATVEQDFAHAPAIVAGPAATPVHLTHDNDGIRPLVTARSLTWRSDAFKVQGWLLLPAGADPRRKHAMVTIVHGGPAAAHTPVFIGAGSSVGSLIGAGYALFLPNPRGSYGQGEAFTAANRRDFGGGDLRDIMAGIDTAIAAAPIDPQRMGLMGGSYGGFMAMWANTQTSRFKAIVAGAGLANWVSYYGTNGIDQWLLPYFGKPLYDDIAAYEAPSAIYHMKAARTPTFLYVGERDIEVPPTQSIEYWHALKELGVPASLVIYPDEGHGVRAPANAADLRRRTLEWFGRYLR